MPTTDNNVFWTGAYPRPIIGKKEDEETRKINERMKKERLNQYRNDVPERIVVAKSGDVAYEYGTSSMGFTNPQGKKVAWDAGYVRCWRKADGQWKVDLTFIRPIDTKMTAYQAPK